MGNDEMLAKTAVWPALTPGGDLSGHDHDYLFVKDKSGRYYDIAPELGVDLSHVSRGLAIGDLGHDGRLDLVAANQWDRSYEYKNIYNGANSFLGLRIMLPLMAGGSNTKESGDENSTMLRFAVGASVKLFLPGNKVVPSYVDGGNGHSGKNSNEVFFGLGKIAPDQKVKIEIQYRDLNGRIRKTILRLNPGWHTVILET
jgi:hypothetical protein